MAREKFIITEEDQHQEDDDDDRRSSRSERLPFRIYSRCGDQTKGNDESLPSYYLLALFLYLLLFGYVASVIDDSMPAVVKDNEAGTTKFSEERAWQYLREIVGNGPRVAGTKYHLEKTKDLKRLLDDVKGNATINVHTDWQIVSGNFSINHYVSVYDNVSNIIALLEGESGLNPDGTTNSSILLNCHYDSVPTSPGASDNALFCSALVEVLSILSRRQKKLKHNVVFLFNGAEENPLQGAPGFLKHKWAHGVNALVNLDAAGTNCKSMLFQVSDSRVVSAYSRSVPRPSAQAFGEVLFRTGIIPSDTDFRIFRDLAGIYGVDIAFTKQGQVYHTRHDSIQTIQRGVIQHSGDMLLALAKELASSDDFYNKAEKSKSVYWDYANLVMFVYSESTASILDWNITAVAILSVIYYHWIVGIRKSLIKELALSVLSRVLACLCGALCLWIVAGLTVNTTEQLKYLSNAWIVVPMYWVPYLVGAVTVSMLFDAWRSKKCGLNRTRRVAQAMTATRIILIFVTLPLLSTSNTATMRYVITIPLLLMSLSAFVTLSVVKSCRVRGWQHFLLTITLATPALLLYMILSIKVNSLMQPIMGRSPKDNPDYMVAGLNMVLVTAVTLPLSGIELQCSRVRLWTILLGGAIAGVVTGYIPFEPYSATGPRPALQRHYWFHSDIRSFNENGIQTVNKSGILMAKTEVNTPQSVLQYTHLKSSTDFGEICSKSIFCNLPTFTPRSAETLKGSMWIDFEPPTVSNPPPKLTVNKTCNDKVPTTCFMNFTVIGAPHMSIVVAPLDNVTLVSWSLTPVRGIDDNGRTIYYIYYSRPTYSEHVTPFEFSLLLQVNQSSPMIDVVHNSHRIFHENEFTPAYRDLVNSMPDYFNIATFLSSRFNYVF